MNISDVSSWIDWCPGAESNHRHRDFQSRALPTELPGRICGSCLTVLVSNWAVLRFTRGRPDGRPLDPQAAADQGKRRHSYEKPSRTATGRQRPARGACSRDGGHQSVDRARPAGPWPAAAALELAARADLARRSPSTLRSAASNASRRASSSSSLAWLPSRSWLTTIGLVPRQADLDLDLEDLGLAAGCGAAPPGPPGSGSCGRSASPASTPSQRTRSSIAALFSMP